MNAENQYGDNKAAARDSSTAGPAWLPRSFCTVPRQEALLIGRDQNCLANILNQLLAESRSGTTGELQGDAPQFSHCGIDDLSSQPQLPYPSGSFGLVLGHHLSANIAMNKELLAEIRRVTAENGHLVLIDYVVPGTRLRGKKARLVRQAGDYINAWFRLRNPEHCQFLAEETWDDLLRQHVWQVRSAGTRDRYKDFDSWALQYPQSERNLIRLRVMLLQAPENVRRFLTPLGSGARIEFHLTERCILAAAA